MTMKRYQFYSERIYARASRPIPEQLRKAASESRTWTAREIVQELVRDPGHCTHVGPDVEAPVAIDGYPPAQLHLYMDALEAQASRQTESYTRRGKEHTRLMKTTTPIMLAAVASYPEPTLEDSLERRRWIELVVSSARARWGKLLRAVIAHVDETFFHLHLIVDNDGRPVRGLHMGHAAASAEPISERRGEAYRAGCSAVQDWYHKNVAGPMGWARMSPTPRKRVGRASAMRKRQAEMETLEVDLRARALRISQAEAELQLRDDHLKKRTKTLREAAEDLDVLRVAIEDQGALEARLLTATKKGPKRL